MFHKNNINRSNSVLQEPVLGRSLPSLLVADIIGAIALGNPLGCTGAKLTATLLHEMKRRGIRYGMVTICVGGGMGAAGIFENLL